MLPVIEPLGRMNGEDVAAALVGAPLERCGFVDREERLAFELLRTFERRGRAEVPDALQIGMSVGRARWRPARLGRKGDAERDGDESRRSDTSLHVHLQAASRLSPDVGAVDGFLRKTPIV